MDDLKKEIQTHFSTDSQKHLFQEINPKLTFISINQKITLKVLPFFCSKGLFKNIIFFRIAETIIDHDISDQPPNLSKNILSLTKQIP